MRKNNKQGGYLVEAALTVPIFILAVFMLLSGVPTLSARENAVFSMTDEIRLETVKAAFRENPYVLPTKIKGRIYAENKQITRSPVIGTRYLYTKHQIDDLISVTYAFRCEGNDPMGWFKSTSFSGKITARAFTGMLHQKTPSGHAESEKLVYIFPEWGMRYHRELCTYVKGSCEMVYLTEKTKKDYEPCSLCDAKSAQIGSPVFCFLRYGEVYHLASCRQVKRYYVKMELSQAEKQGYQPCTKCGG